MIGKRFRLLPFIFANDNYTLSLKDLSEPDSLFDFHEISVSAIFLSFCVSHMIYPAYSSISSIFTVGLFSGVFSNSV